MISFIIIGRNEGWRLKLCLKSAEKTIKQCKLNAEIIYVDSQSTDDSLRVVKEFALVKVFVITGKYNAAIARNIGVKESQGDSLVFLDGDMEVNPDFLSLIFDDQQKLKYDFVSGNFMNYYYDDEGNFLSKDFYKKIYCAQDTYQYTTGGLFAIKRTIWESVGGMKSKYKKGQDLDFGYRLANRGVFLLRKKECMANHHTIDYKNEKRLWRSFSDGTYVYPRAVLYRDHFFNKYVLKRLLTSDPTWLMLMMCIITSATESHVYPLLVYVFFSVAAVMYSMRKIGFKGLFNRVVNHVFRDIFNVFALFLFFPRKTKELAYKKV
ncbi:glycosyltransferase family 2 protein [Labilibacter sediminis]|nr:glycosyltransferase family 2 protein [Labilibacter sediminis]